MIIPTAHDKAEWARYAQAAYKTGHNRIGHRYSAMASIPNGYGMDISVFDTLQHNYRQWLIWSVFEG